MNRAIRSSWLRWRRWIILFVAGLLLIVAINFGRSLLTSRTPPELQPAVTPLPQDTYIQAFFNQSEASVYTDPYRHITRYGDDLEQVIITAIDQSTTTVDVAVQALNLPLIAQALVQSAARGVRIRVVLENQYANPTSAEEQAKQRADWMAIADANRDGTLTPTEIAQADALQILRSAQIPLIDDTADGSKGSGLMHHKFIVIDSQWVLTGSANLTLSGIHGDGDQLATRGNANALLKIDSPEVASPFTEEFNLLWGDGPGAKANSQFGLKKPHRLATKVLLPTSDLTLQFSPISSSKLWENSVNGLVSRTLSQAAHSIDLALFVFSEQRIANTLQAQAKSGTSLRVLIDHSFIYRSYSEALDMLGIALPNQRCQIETDNQPWNSPISSVGTPQIPVGDKLHHKFAVIDNDTVIVGSQNWSHAANTKNDETLIVLQNPTVAAHFSREFERLYHNAFLGQTAQLNRKITQNQQRCRLSSAL